VAWIAADSFDYYGAIADLARSVWDSFTNIGGSSLTLNTATTRFGTGQSLRCPSSSAGVIMTKAFGANEGTVFVALARYRSNALSGTAAETYLELRDGATAQCTVVFQSNGDLVLKSGTSGGTVLATYSAAFAQDVWTQFQIRVVISNTAGSMTVRKNGQTSDSYASATNLNTRGGTANNYATAIALGNGAAVTSTPWFLEDLLIYSGSGAAPNDWVGDVRAVCLPPVADTAQKQMVPSPAGTTTVGGPAFSTRAFAANTIYWGSLTPARSGAVTKATIVAAAGLTGHARIALYAPDATGLPGALIAVSAEVTNPVAAGSDFTFSAGTNLVAGRAYFAALLLDAAWTANTINLSANYTLARTYSAGFPDPAGVTTFAAAQPPALIFTVAGNIVTVSEVLANGDTDFVAGSNVNDADLYDVADLPLTPTTILGVVTKVYLKKSDAGARSGQLLVKSGATQVAGTDTVLGTTYTYLARVDTVDPNTGAAWSAGAINAVQIGQKVTA